MRTPNVFAGPYLDRAAHLRKDAAFVASALADPGSLLVPLWQARNLLRRADYARSAALVEVRHALRGEVPDGELVLLGLFRGHACFAVDLVTEPAPTLPADASFEDLRVAAGLLPQDEAGLLA